MKGAALAFALTLAATPHLPTLLMLVIHWL